MTDYNLLLPDAIRQRLDNLLLTPRKIRSSGMKGERRSTKRGTSIEFADYRNYVAGDDLRKLDWNVYARLDRPTIKLYEDEEDLTVHLLIDNSASMGAISESSPDSDKLGYAKRLVAGLGFVGLNGGDRVLVSDLATHHAPFIGRGRTQILGLLRHLVEIKTHGKMDLNASLKQYALREKRAGMCFVVTDLFAPNGYMDGLNALMAKGHEVTVIHTLAPEEMNPPLVGDLRLVDVETGTAQEVTIDAHLRAQYEASLQQWLTTIRADCTKRGIVYVPVTTDTPSERLLVHDFRKLGLMK